MTAERSRRSKTCCATMRARGTSSRSANSAETNSVKGTENTGSVAKQQPPRYTGRPPHQQHSIAEACPVLYTCNPLHPRKIGVFVQGKEARGRLRGYRYQEVWRSASVSSARPTYFR